MSPSQGKILKSRLEPLNRDPCQPQRHDGSNSRIEVERHSTRRQEEFGGCAMFCASEEGLCPSCQEELTRIQQRKLQVATNPNHAESPHSRNTIECSTSTASLLDCSHKNFQTRNDSTKDDEPIESLRPTDFSCNQTISTERIPVINKNGTTVDSENNHSKCLVRHPISEIAHPMSSGFSDHHQQPLSPQQHQLANRPLQTAKLHQLSSRQNQRQQPSQSRIALSLRRPLNKREDFLMFVKILFKLLANEHDMLRIAKSIIGDCTRRNRNVEPDYTDLSEAVQRNLKPVITESVWTKAHDMLHYFHSNQQRQREQQQLRSASMIVSS